MCTATGAASRLIGRFLAERPGHGITVATKMGRRMEQEPENYTPENFRVWTDRSRANLGVDTLDLVQLHCPPTAVIEDDATYDALDALVADGTIAAYGVSVETCAQALAAIARPNVNEHPDHLQPVPAEAARRGAARRRSGAGRDLRAGAARVGAAVGQVLRVDDFRRQRPPHLQPRGRGVRQGRDLLGRRLRDRSRCRRRAVGRSARGRVVARGDAGVDRVAAGRDDRDPRCAIVSRRRSRTRMPAPCSTAASMSSRSTPWCARSTTVG